MKNSIVKLLFFIILLFACNSGSNRANTKTLSDTTSKKTNIEKVIEYEGNEKTIHLFVALCDNKYQGIVPVPASIGNGQNPKSNLYWGAGYGVKTFFKKSKEWTLLKETKINDTLLERVVFKHKNKGFYLVADAYNGKNIKETVTDFLKSISGIKKDTLHIDNQTIGIYGNSKLSAYIGHNGLMDFELNETFKNTDKKERDAIMLACYSKDYFFEYVKDAKADPIVWSTGLMAPEAYIIHDAINGYVYNETNEQIRLKAAGAYSKYQKCSLKAAKNLLVSGW